MTDKSLSELFFMNRMACTDWDGLYLGGFRQVPPYKTQNDTQRSSVSQATAAKLAAGRRMNMIAYVGCRTTEHRNARGKGIRTFRIDESTGDWTELQTLKTPEENPSYQTLDHTHKFLYSVHGDFTKVSGYRILENNTLEFLNMIDIGGRNPVFIVPDKTNQYLLVAALQGGAVYVIRRNDDGSLGEIVSAVHLPGKTEGSVSFAHQCIWDRTQTYLFVVTQGRLIGYEQIKVFRFDPADGSLTETDTYKSRQYSEPRHVSIHPNNRWVYLINEKGNAMTFLEFDAGKGKLHARQILPSLPDTYTGEGQASASILSQNGKILIGSNRIHESVVTYRIDQNTGYMRQLDFYPTLGLTPRFICFNPDFSRFYVANEDSDTIVEFSLDEEQGRLSFTGKIIPTESPVCITFKNE